MIAIDVMVISNGSGGSSVGEKKQVSNRGGVIDGGGFREWGCVLRRWLIVVFLIGTIASSIFDGLQRKLEGSFSIPASRLDRSLIAIQRQVVDFCCILRTIARRVDWFLRMVHSTETGGFNFAPIATKI